MISFLFASPALDSGSFYYSPTRDLSNSAQRLSGMYSTVVNWYSERARNTIVIFFAEGDSLAVCGFFAGAAPASIRDFNQKQRGHSTSHRITLYPTHNFAPTLPQPHMLHPRRTQLLLLLYFLSSLSRATSAAIARGTPTRYVGVACFSPVVVFFLVYRYHTSAFQHQQQRTRTCTMTHRVGVTRTYGSCGTGELSS